MTHPLSAVSNVAVEVKMWTQPPSAVQYPAVPYDPRMDKTHAMRVLDAHKIPYTAKVYDTSGDFHPGAEAAALIGADPAIVYKTLVVLRDNGPRTKPILVMVPVESEVDLKTLAISLGEKKLRMAKQREAEDMTGMQVKRVAAETPTMRHDHSLGPF